MELLINVINQKLKLATNLKNLVAGSQQFIKLTFNLSEEWDDLLTFAQFIQGENAYSQYLDENNSVYLPHEIQAGTCKVILYGTGSQGEGSQIIATTNYLEFTIDENITVANASSTEISQSLYDQLANQFNTIANLSQSQYGAEIARQVSEIMAGYLANGDIAAATIQDGTITKAKLDSNVSATLDKADNSWQRGENAASGTWDDTYDTNRRKTDIFNYIDGEINSTKNYVDGQIGSITNRTATGSLDLVTQEVNDAKIFRYDYTPQYQTNITGQKNYTTLKDAVQGIYAEALGNAKDYADAKVRESINILIVDELPTTGQARTFYLVPKESGNGYDKWWYVTNSNGVSFWDTFGSTSTVIVPSLDSVETPSVDVDYIVQTDSGYLYYKYIDNQWEMIAGSSAEIISPEYTIDYKEYGTPQSNNYEAEDYSGKYYLNLTDFKVYLSNGANWSLVETLAVASELTDYYLDDGSGTYVHYRYIDNEYKVVGADAYSKSEVDSMIQRMNSNISSVQATVNNNVSNISTNTTNIATLSNTVSGLQQTVAGIDTEGYTYNSTLTQDGDGHYVYTLIETKDNEDTIKSQFVLPSGGGGSGQVSTTTLTVERITTSPLVVTTTDAVRLVYSYESLDMDNEEVDGTYTWKVGGNVIATGTCVQGINTFDATDYCTIGTQKFSLTITDEGGSTSVKSWTVQKVDVRIESTFTDKIAYPVGSAVNFTYTPYGAVSKTVHFILDGVELNSVTTSSSGMLQSYSIPAQTHGSHLLECFMTATINSIEVETEHIYKDIVWFDETSNVPVIGCIYKNDYFHIVKEPINENLDEYYTLNNGQYSKATYKVVTNPTNEGMSNYYELSGIYYIHAVGEQVNSNKTYYVKEITDGITYYSHSIYSKQYDTTKIPYYVFDSSTGTPTVTRTADGNSVTQSLTSNSDIWAYKSSTTGERNLVISCGSTSVTITMNIIELDIDVNPVTANLAFDFNPAGLSNNSQNRLWVDSNNSNINMTVSNNFDWSNGGYQLDSEGNQYFCVKAGTTATFNYNLFENSPKTQGMEFKLIFKTTNVKRADAQFLNCIDTVQDKDIGLQMNTHEAYLKTTVDTLYMPYSEDDIIEFEINVNTLDTETSGATSIVMSYEDGVGMRPMIYNDDHRFHHVTPKPIVIGSENCDVHIYRMKAYSSALTDSDILSNFIADAPNADEMIARYNRNQIYDENNNLTPESVANACPDLKVIMIECPQFTNNKSNFVKYTNVRCIHKNGDPVLDNWTFTNCYHSGQGTTSNNYGYAGRNIDIICCMDGVNQYSSKITFDENYKTTLVLGDGTRFENGTGKVSLSRTSVPNNWFNIKVNIASSENANNALLQKRYNDYLPYTPASKARDQYAKNDMEFYNCVVFVKETGNANGTTVSRREFTDSNWHFYAIGNIGDSKKTDATRANNPDDMKEFCVEISDNTLPNAAFQTGVYAEYTAVSTPNVSNISSYYELNGSIYTLTKDTSLVSGKTYYTRGAVNYSGTGTMIYPITESQWNNANNVKRVNLQYSFDKDEADDYKASFEFRYDMGGETRDGDTTGLSSAERTAQRERNKQIFRDFYKWVITSSNSDFVNQLDGWFIKESALYWYLFTERYTMIDNRSKNTFWHFGDTGVYRPVPCPSSMFMDYYYERSGNEGNYTYTLTSDSSVDSNKTYYWKYAFEMWDYDNDTAIGINNSGELTMTYGKEDIDYRTDGVPSSGYIFNAADNVFWRRIRILMDSQLRAMYQTLDSSNCWSSTSLINEYDTWQSQFPEELWRLDIERKYYRTYRGEGLNAGATPSPTPRFLKEMMNGRKKYQRRQFERDQYAYMGTKYLSSSIMADHIEFRCNTPINAVVTPNYDLTIVPYSDMYLSVTFGNTSAVQIRAKGGVSYTVECPIKGTMNKPPSMDDTMFIIYCASRIQALNDISACYIHDNNFASATRLQTLVIGNSTSGYENQFLTTLNLGSMPLLESLDIRNCPNLTGSLNLSTCTNLLTLRAEGTSLTAVTFANYGKISTVYLPNSIVSLTMKNLNYLSNVHSNLDNLFSLNVENGIYNTLALLQNTYDTVQELRLVGIDWTIDNTSLLNSCLAMNTSYLSGNIYISTAARNSELSKFNEAWEDLNFTYPSLVTEHLFIFQNPNGTELYRMYCDYDINNPPPDPVQTNLISTPTMASDGEYDYTYSGWLNMPNNVTEDSVVTANYTRTKKKYIVAWYAQGDTNGNPVNGSKLDEVEVEYGSEVSYEYQKVESPVSSNLANYYEFTGGQYISSASSTFSSTKTYYTKRDLPTDTSGEIDGYYRLFKGWDKSTGYIRGNINVIAQWETRSGLPSRSTDLKDMSCVDIYAVCQAKKADKEVNPTDGRWLPKDYFEITLGHDLDFSNVTSKTLVDLDYPVFFNGSDGTNTGTRIVYHNGVGETHNDSFIDFDGSNSTTNPEIKLFSADAPSFTLAIEYEYLSTNTNGVMLSAGSEDDVDGFKLNYSSSNPCIRWGNNNQAIGASDIRNIMVLRHVKGSDILYAYTYNSHSDRYTDIGNSSYPLRYMLQRTNTSGTEPVLSLGAVRYKNGVTHDYFAKGWVYWCKLWEDDLGDTNAKLLAAWIHEKIRMEYTGRGISGLRRYAIANTNSQVTTYAEASFLANNSLSLLHNMNNSDTNVGGWAESNMRKFLNTRVYNALPLEWRSAIKSVNVKSSIGGGSSGNNVTTTSTSVDKLYLAAYTELVGANSSYNGETYNNNIINYFVSNSSTYYYKKVKFTGLIVKNQNEDGTQYFGVNENLSIDPTDSSLGYTVNEGDVWFRYDGANKIGYMYVSEDTLAKHTRIGFRAVSSNDNIAAFAGGRWVRANGWWERSPAVSSSATFFGVGNAGTTGGGGGGAGGAYGVAVGFSV